MDLIFLVQSRKLSRAIDWTVQDDRRINMQCMAVFQMSISSQQACLDSCRECPVIDALYVLLDVLCAAAFWYDSHATVNIPS